MEPLWQSSNLEKPTCEYVLEDLDADGKDELVVTEGEYDTGRSCTARHIAVWKWNEWGFYNEWRNDFAARMLHLRTGIESVTVDVFPQ